MGLTTSRNNKQSEQSFDSTATNIPRSDACFRNPIYGKSFVIQRQNEFFKNVFDHSHQNRKVVR